MTGRNRRGFRPLLCGWSSVPHRTLAVAALSWAIAGPVAGQHVVSGHVMEPGESRIGGARVELTGSVAVTTGADGEFRFESVSGGLHTLTVEALGYRGYSAEIRVTADTTIVVELRVDPIRLDSLLVRGGDVRIRGTVTDAETGDRLPGAHVFVGADRRTQTDLSGRFDVRDVPVGLAIAVDVRLLEYLPVRIALITERDTTFDIGLERDPVAVQMVEAHVRKLRDRSEAFALSLIEMDRERLLRFPSWTVWDILQNRFSGRLRITCLFVDEIPIEAGRRGYLESYLAQDIQRIEVFGRGRMVRIYSRTYFTDRLFGDDAALAPILFVEGTGPPQCG